MYSETIEALDNLLTNKQAFNEVLTEIFNLIDTDKSGEIELMEIKDFMTKICKEMGLQAKPDQDAIDNLFQELDTDHSNTIEKTEMAIFLKRLFIEQKELLERKQEEHEHELDDLDEDKIKTTLREDELCRAESIKQNALQKK